MSISASHLETEAPPSLLQRLADAHPELDNLRWRISLPSGQREFLAGDRVEGTAPGVAIFVLDDGTTREFAPGEWSSAVRLPGKPAPVLDAIIRRLHLCGLASHLDILNAGAWLQAQPEWLEEQRRLAEKEQVHAGA